MPIKEHIPLSTLKKRRETLIDTIKQSYDNAQNGIILLIGDFEHERSRFTQDRSFYYLTGIEEPASTMAIDLQNNTSTLFVPNFGDLRQKWVANAITTKQDPKMYGVDAIEYLGKPCVGYQCHPFFNAHEYENIIDFLKKIVTEKRPIFTLAPNNVSSYVEQRFVLQRLAEHIPGFKQTQIDISPIVAQMRRTKSRAEIENLYKAIDITIDAHIAAAQAIQEGKNEFEVQAAIEYIFTSSGASAAFASIVASGKNATTLHYMDNNGQIGVQDLVVVDIGAEYNYYCADLSRTYPVSGAFTKRQKEVYNLVLETQEYIAGCAKPGYWLSNPDQPDKSLHHLAKAFLEKRGYAQYFTHGIGHFLGLDVHDVGDYKKPLQKGDVITIEPGIYIPQEKIGVRIEDDYWVVDDGVICLSEDLPKHPDDIERMVQQSFVSEENELEQ